MPSLWSLFLWFAPLLAAFFVMMRKPVEAVNVVDQVDTWIARQVHLAADAEDFIGRYVMRPVLWPLKRIGDLTCDIEDPFLKTALRILAGGYLLSLLIVVTHAMPYVFGTLLVFVVFLAAVQSLLNGSGASKPFYAGRQGGDAPTAPPVDASVHPDDPFAEDRSSHG